VTEGKGNIRVNGKSINVMEPISMRLKVVEPILLLGQKRFENLNVRVKVRGGGSTSQAMAIRMSIAKGIIAFTQKYDDESTKRELKELLLQYDKGLLVSDPRRCEPKKFGGHGARARYQKSYR
jgi:small subunit ribosomal protein S16e